MFHKAKTFFWKLNAEPAVAVDVKVRNHSQPYLQAAEATHRKPKKRMHWLYRELPE